MRNLLLISLFFSFIAIACTDASTSTGDDPDPNPDPTSYTIEPAFPNLSFSNPLDLQHPGDESNRLFVVEQEGIIKVFENDPSVSQAEVFLDIGDKVSSGGERGLLGLAFHPNFESNGYFYVNYTAPDPLRTRISRFQAAGGEADPSSETIILSYSQPFGNHNGGQLRFGPDGYLYIASGDGGGSGDPNENAQNRRNLLGKILRIDVDAAGNGSNYGIPPSNPFVGNEQGFSEEIFAYGLRNPFRFSFDAETGLLWAGDVGQNRFEEINIIENGNNYGWNIVEGNECFEPAEDCDRTGLTDPVFVYDHSNNDRSVTGGFVYRGDWLPGLHGRYVYADFISGRIWSLDASTTENPENQLIENTDLPISSFGVDASNELYFTAFDGTVYHFVEQ